MMNVVALAFLASCFTGLVVVVPPPPPQPQQQRQAVHASYEALHSAKQALKEAAQKIVCDQPPCPPTTLDTLKETLHHGYQKTADTLKGAEEFASDRIEAAKESAEDAYQHFTGSIHETAEKAKHGIHATVEKAKHGMHAATDMAASSVPGKDTQAGSHFAEESDPVSYIMPGVSQTMESLKRKLDEEKHEISSLLEGLPAMDSLKKKAEQAAAYMPSAKQGEKSTESVKERVTEQVHDWQDKARDMQGGACDMLGGGFHGLQEKLVGGAPKKEYKDELAMKVHELCNWLGDVRTVEGSKQDRDTFRKSYAYFMESALRAIGGAKEVFEKSIEGEGRESKEKYMNLVESAKGALEGAKEIFDRAITTMGNHVPYISHGGLGNSGKSVLKDEITQEVPRQLTTRLKEAAVHTKHRLSATIRPLLRTFYLASFSAVFGVTLWNTFFSGYLLARALPRQQLAVVQSKFFPTYLCVITACLAVCAIGHMVLHPWPFANQWERLQHWNFSVSLMISLINTLLIEPKVTKIMFERLKVEKEEGRGQSGDAMDEATRAQLNFIDVKLKGLHQIAPFGNLAIVAGLTWHLWYLANRLLV